MSEVVLDPARRESVKAGDAALVDRSLAAEGIQVRARQVLARQHVYANGAPSRRRTTASWITSWSPANLWSAAMSSRL
jgi:hypothetical protein